MVIIALLLVNLLCLTRDCKIKLKYFFILIFIENRKRSEQGRTFLWEQNMFILLSMGIFAAGWRRQPSHTRCCSVRHWSSKIWWRIWGATRKSSLPRLKLRGNRVAMSNLSGGRPTTFTWAWCSTWTRAHSSSIGDSRLGNNWRWVICSRKHLTRHR